MNRGVICHENEEGYTICRGIDSSFQNWHRNLTKFNQSTEKSKKNSL